MPPTSATHRGNAHVQGLNTDVAYGAIAFTNPDGTSFAGYVSPNLQSFQLKPSAKTDKIAGQDGYTTGLMGSDEMLEMTFDFIPEGDSKTHALASAGFPGHLASAQITGLPIIAIGPFADALNTNGASAQPYFFEMDAQLNGKAVGYWDGTITLRRYRKITSAAPIT